MTFKPPFVAFTPANVSSTQAAALAPALRGLASFLGGRGLSAWLVGGSVRDLLLGRTTRDLDLVVAGSGVALARALADAHGGSFVLLDEARDIGRALLPAHIFGDSVPWVVDVAGWRGQTLEEDLGQRDFTVNAMALPISPPSPDGSLLLLDPHGGQADLEGRLIRLVSSHALRDDPLRLLRAVRLAAELDFGLEPATARRIQEDSPLLGQAAPERVRQELVALVRAPRLSHHLAELDHLGLLPLIFPELADAKGVTQPSLHHWDVFGHSLATAGAAEGLLQELPERFPELPLDQHFQRKGQHFAREMGEGCDGGVLLKVAALLHDIGKPLTRTQDPDGRIRFLRHSQVGADLAQAMLRRLRFSGRETQAVCTMVRHHLRPADLCQSPQAPSPRAIYRYFRDTDPVGVDTLILHLADLRATRGPKLREHHFAPRLEAVRCLLQGYFAPQSPLHPPQLLDGHDVMAALGLAPGPRVGRWLERLREAQAEGLVTSREEALAFLKGSIPASRDPHASH